MPLIDYKLHSLEKKYDLSRSEDKRSFVAEALKIVRSAESESEKEDLLKKLRDRTGFTYQSLERDLQNLPAEGKQTEISRPVLPEAAAGTDKYKKAARFVLARSCFRRPMRKNATFRVSDSTIMCIKS